MGAPLKRGTYGASPPASSKRRFSSASFAVREKRPHMGEGLGVRDWGLGGGGEWESGRLD